MHGNIKLYSPETLDGLAILTDSRPILFHYIDSRLCIEDRHLTSSDESNDPLNGYSVRYSHRTGKHRVWRDPSLYDYSKSLLEEEAALSACSRLREHLGSYIADPFVVKYIDGVEHCLHIDEWLPYKCNPNLSHVGSEPMSDDDRRWMELLLSEKPHNNDGIKTSGKRVTGARRIIDISVRIVTVIGSIATVGILGYVYLAS